MREAVVRALGAIDDARAVPALTRALNDDNTRVRAQVANALRAIDDESAGPALVRRLQRESVDTVRYAIVRALGAIRHTDGISAITGTLSDEHDEATRPLIRALDNPDAQVRAGAARALGRIKNAAAVQPLIDRLQSDSDPRVRTRVATALGEIRAGSAIPALSAAVADSSTTVRRAVVAALAAMRDDRATEALISALQDSDADVRRRAARALGRRGG